MRFGFGFGFSSIKTYLFLMIVMIIIIFVSALVDFAWEGEQLVVFFQFSKNSDLPKSFVITILSLALNNFGLPRGNELSNVMFGNY